MLKVLLGTVLGALIAIAAFILLHGSPDRPGGELPAPTVAATAVEPDIVTREDPSVELSALDRPATTALAQAVTASMLEQLSVRARQLPAGAGRDRTLQRIRELEAMDAERAAAEEAGDAPPGRPFTFNGRTYYVVPLE